MFLAANKSDVFIASARIFSFSSQRQLLSIHRRGVSDGVRFGGQW
jgi:hypothetical protein